MYLLWYYLSTYCDIIQEIFWYYWSIYSDTIEVISVVLLKYLL